MRPADRTPAARGGNGLFRPLHMVPQARLRRDAMLVDAAGTGGVWRVAGPRSPWRLLRGRHALAPEAGRSCGRPR
jgi:hypothetical protein